MKILGVTGRAGSGKDTIADYICKEHGYIKYSLAGPMKKALDGMLVAAGGVPVNWNNRAEKEAKHPMLGCSVRRWLQLFGTDFSRNMINDSIWLNLANSFINKYDTRKYSGVVIADCRFSNEASWLRERGGRMIHVIRHGITEVEGHISEAGIEILNGDIVIVNDGSISTLQSKVRDGLNERAAA